jgi:hypothetical protein
MHSACGLSPSHPNEAARLPSQASR